MKFLLFFLIVYWNLFLKKSIWFLSIITSKFRIMGIGLRKSNICENLKSAKSSHSKQIIHKFNWIISSLIIFITWLLSTLPRTIKRQKKIDNWYSRYYLLLFIQCLVRSITFKKYIFFFFFRQFPRDLIWLFL